MTRNSAEKLQVKGVSNCHPEAARLCGWSTITTPVVWWPFGKLLTTGTATAGGDSLCLPRFQQTKIKHNQTEAQYSQFMREP